MSTENKVCFNCGHFIRERDEEEAVYTRCHCEIHGEFRPYINVMTSWCEHWAKERRGKSNIKE